MKKRLSIWNGLLLVGILGVFLAAGIAQDQADDEKVWESFRTWILTNPTQPSLKAYGEKLAAEGLTEDEVQKQLDTIRRLFKDHPEKGVEITYDRIFSKPLTGDPEKDGFTATPSVFMMESVKGFDPGTALDVGAGQVFSA